MAGRGIPLFINLVLIFSVCATLVCEAAPASSAKKLHVLVWNIDRGYRLPEVAAAIRKQGSDVCLLQEVDLNARRTGRRDIAAGLARDLGMNFVFGDAFQELSQGSSDEPARQGQAILANSPLEATRVIRFARQTRFWEPRPYLPAWFLQRRSGGRIALASELDFGGRAVVLYNLHLESRGFGYTRYAQLAEVIEDSKRYPPGTPIVLAGDLNTKYVPARFVSLLEKAGFRNCFGSHRQRTHHIAFTLDWIFVRGAIQCEAAQVHREVAVSDHYPLTATLRLD